MYESHTQRAVSVVFFLLSFFIGLYIGDARKVREEKIVSKNKETSNFSETHDAVPSLMGSINSFAAQKFACDPGRAYEELSRLQERSTVMDILKTKQANRARTATMTRKASEARAAKGAFRSCVSLMMPELLTQWDSDFKEQKIHKKWSDRNEIEMDGITKEVLEKTAEILDK